jgi:hypothetical protein
MATWRIFYLRGCVYSVGCDIFYSLESVSPITNYHLPLFQTSIIPPMEEELEFKSFGISSLALTLIGFGGLYFIITQTLPFVWSRWAFFIFLFMGLTGIALPVVYFLHKRFPSQPPVESNVIMRQSFWAGAYGSTLAWLQLGKLVTLNVMLVLAGGFIAAEYFIRLREKANRRPPILSDDDSA